VLAHQAADVVTALLVLQAADAALHVVLNASQPCLQLPLLLDQRA